MVDRPILFSGAMVAAILAGRKTQTRRIVKPQPGLDNRVTARDRTINVRDPKMAGICPFGQPGDRLWVRETWALVPASAYRCSEGVQQIVNPADPDMAAVYAAGWDRSRPGRWRPSIHMPRWASRITLEITGVRCERLNDISEDDAQAEGIVTNSDGTTWRVVPELKVARRGSPIEAYRDLWDLINGPGSWDANPWVWVVEFKRAEASHG